MLYFFLRFYLFIHERQTERERERERQRHKQREKKAPSREPDVGLNPRTPGSLLELEGRRLTTEPPWCPLSFISNGTVAFLLCIY